MTSNREERFLMRQRGAGTRQLQDFGFQIAVPGAANAPLRPQKSGRSRRTPQPELPQQRSTRRTPKVTQPLPARSSKRTPLTANGKRLGRLPKGDLSKTQEEELPSSSRQTQSSADGSIAKKRKLAQLSQETNETTTMQSAGFTKPQQGLAIEGGGVNQEGSNEVRAKKRKKRKSIGQVSRKRIKSGLPDVLEEQSPPSQQSAAGIASEELQIRPDLIDNNTKVDDLPIASTSQQNVKKPRKKKRKSIGKIPKSRKKPASTNVVEEKTGTDSPSGIVLVEEAAAEEEEGEQDEGEQAEEEPTPKTMAPPSRSRGRPRKLLPTVDEETQDEDLDLGESVKPVVPARKMQRKKATNHDVVEQLPTEPSSEVPIVVLEAVTKPKHRRQKQLRAPSPASSQPKAKKPRQPRKDSIPITVHRLSQSHLLQPDRSNSDPESDTDILSLASSFPQKNSVNAVDVLSQVCSELIAKTISTLQQETQDQPSAARKAEWKRKRKAVEMFGEELNARLFQLTEALDTHNALNTRLKKATKQKLALRTTLLRLRRERQDIALQTDQIRATHEKASKNAQAQSDLSTKLHDIELAVHRGRAAQLSQASSSAADTGVKGGDLAGLKVLLGELVEGGISSVDGNGLLEQVRGLNAILERAVGGV